MTSAISHSNIVENPLFLRDRQHEIIKRIGIFQRFHGGCHKTGNQINGLIKTYFKKSFLVLSGSGAVYQGQVNMNLFSGIAYNYRGLKLGIKTPGLLFLGLVRFLVIIAVTIIAVGFVFKYYNEILNLIWLKPESVWLIWLWYLVSWIVALFLAGLLIILSFLISQLLFSIIIMDIMSKITERIVSGKEENAGHMPWFKYFFYLIRQEIPRAFIPILIAMVLMILGWLTPLAPVMTVLSSLSTVIFLAWDNTDLVPARRLEPFGIRFKFLLNNLGFHLGFGLWFLIPGLNIIFLSFAPVGGTLFYLAAENSIKI